MTHTTSSSLRRGPRSGERGVTLVIALIALVILTVGAIAMVRSANTSLFMAGNLAFKRDLANQSERAILAALTDLRTGGLAADTAREANRNASNYSASVLASSAQGIPTILLDSAAYAAAGFSASDISDSGITIRYVIDRQCSAAGSFSNTLCQFDAVSGDAQGGGGKGGGGGGAKGLGATVRPIYRVSVRVSGPRGVQTFTQTTAVF